MKKVTGESYDIFYGMVNPHKPSEVSWKFIDSLDTRADAIKIAKRNHLLGVNYIRVIRVCTTLEWTSESTL